MAHSQSRQLFFGTENMPAVTTFNNSLVQHCFDFYAIIEFSRGEHCLGLDKTIAPPGTSELHVILKLSWLDLTPKSVTDTLSSLPLHLPKSFVSCHFQLRCHLGNLPQPPYHLPLPGLNSSLCAPMSIL